MRVRAIRLSEMTGQHERVWTSLLRERPEYFSPFLTPEFARAVASVRDDVELAVAEDQGRIVGFLPFQRGRWNVGHPVGAGLNEFQAIVLDRRVLCVPTHWVRECGLSCWNFDHVVADQTPFAEYFHRVGESPYMDLSAGFEAYLRDRRADGSTLATQTGRKARKLRREVGKLTFLWHSDDNSLFEKLLEWKSRQHRRTGVVDAFQCDWIVRLLRRVRDSSSDGFRGMYSVLLSGDRPVAVHLGISTPDAAHMWYPAYDPEFARYSPGAILLLELARSLAERGVRRLDLGPGPQAYKRRLMSDVTHVGLGSVDSLKSARLARHAWRRAEDWVRNSRWRAPARSGAGMIRRFRQWMSYP